MRNVFDMQRNNSYPFQRYIRRIMKFDMNKKRKFICNDYNILHEIPNPNQTILFVMEQLEKEVKFFHPYYINYFVMVLGICIFLKERNVHVSKWISYLP